MSLKATFASMFSNVRLEHNSIGSISINKIFSTSTQLFYQLQVKDLILNFMEKFLNSLNILISSYDT